jgi:hypothetical protein
MAAAHNFEAMALKLEDPSSGTARTFLRHIIFRRREVWGIKK